ncbi:MAG: hypothetical protein JSS72_00845 [Armatimonadetes bacterium]|nr:hypothetical protein [Armatimonadota bacterium]
MSDSFEEQQVIKLGVAGALSREFAADQTQFLNLIAETLKKAFPAETNVLTKGLFTKKTVGFELMLGDCKYRLEQMGSRLEATKAKIVRGIALKTDSIPVEQCLSELSEQLEAKAQQSGVDRAALARLLGLD